MKRCVVCDRKLTGQQSLYCGPTCKKRRQRHPEKYPLPEPVVKIVPQRSAGDEVVSAMIRGAASSGDTRRGLEALRDRLATEIDRCDDPKAVATLSARLMDTFEKLDALKDNKPEGGVLDEFTRRRDARRSADA